MRFFLVLLAAAVLSTPVRAAAIPEIANPGFESGLDNWSWQIHGAFEASCRVDTANPHSGKSCLHLSANTLLTPHCFGRLKAYVPVIPSARYELSCWVRGEDVSAEGGVNHWTDWGLYTLNLPTGTFGWTRVVTEITMPPGRQTLEIGLNLVNKCKALAIDDVVLRPLGGELKGHGVSGIALTSPKVIGHDAPVPLSALIDYSGPAGAWIECSVNGGGRKVMSRRSPLRGGENRIDWHWNSGRLPFGSYETTIRIVDNRGAVLASDSMAVEVVDSPLLADIDAIEQRKVEFDALFEKCRAAGVRMDYPTVTKTALEQFIPLSREDVRAGLDWRANNALIDFNRMLDEGIAELRNYLSEPSLAPVARRYVTGPVDIDGTSFVGNRRDFAGKRDRGPVFFCGYGHFYQIRADMHRWPAYGVNILQSADFGPSAVFPGEGRVELAPVEALVRMLDDASKRNVRVDFLVSPHYFPQWAMSKYPHLAKGGGGFLGFCVDDPAAKAIVEEFLRIVLPRIADKPALHSICLTNEPMFNNTANCDNTRPLWTDYLVKTYSRVSALNEAWGTDHASIDDVGMVGDAPYYDYCIFNNERFAGWHKWMVDICHELAPGVPVHAKIMSTQLNPDFVGAGDDHELFGRVHDLNGNDCYMFPTFNPEWPIDPWMLNTGYDMQRSFNNKPIFNSENHIAPDNSAMFMAPEHYRVALWQGAIHGQSSTTIWVWEREFDSRNGFVGNVMDRPASARAVGITCLDLNRFADEVAAMQKADAPVGIVYSLASMIRHGRAHAGAVMRAYQGLNFCGVRIGFLSDRQLAEGRGSQYRLIVVPEVETIPEASLAGLRALPSSVRLLFMNRCFTRDPYGRKRDEQAVSEAIARGSVLTDGDPQTVLWPALRKELAEAGALPECEVVDAATGEPVWGVEWLSAQIGGRTVINLVNYRGEPRDVLIRRAGALVDARDLLSRGGRDRVRTLRPLTPVLAEIR